MNWTLAPATICAVAGEMLTLTGVGTSEVPFGGAPEPFPPLHETCWVMAISASHLAMARILERGEALRTSR